MQTPMQSQNPRMAEDEGTSGGHLVQHKQGYPQQVAQNHVQVAFEGLQGGRYDFSAPTPAQ